MGVTVKDRADREAGERILEPAAAEERKDLERLAFDGGLDRRVVEQRDDVLVAQARERGLELQRFVDRFVHELLDDLFAPRTERPAPEAAGEALDAGEADPEDLGGVAVEHDDAGVLEDPGDLALLARFEVVVAEDGDDRNLDGGKQLLDEAARLFDQAVVGQVAAEDENVGRLANLGEQRLQRSRRRRAAVVQIAERGDTNGVLRRHAPAV